MTDNSPIQLTTGPSLAGQAYLVLRDMITSGALAYGERVPERALAKRLGVSPTPIREAISRLEHERLLERPEGRGLRVVVPTLQRLREMAMIQAALRGLAARLAAENASDAELLAIEQALKATNAIKRTGRSLIEITDERLELNRRFHQLIDVASHNPSLVDMIATAIAYDWPMRVRGTQATSQGGASTAAPEEHAQIVQALLARDGDKADELCRAHALDGSQKYLAWAELHWPELF
jgi:DNA-binding GntR family transcriptional regulator